MTDETYEYYIVEDKPFNDKLYRYKNTDVQYWNEYYHAWMDIGVFTNIHDRLRQIGKRISYIEAQLWTL